MSKCKGLKLGWQDKLRAAIQTDETGCIFGIATTTVETTQQLKGCSGLQLTDLDQVMDALFTESEDGCFALNLTPAICEGIEAATTTEIIQICETATFPIDPFEDPTTVFEFTLAPDKYYAGIEDFELNGVDIDASTYAASVVEGADGIETVTITTTNPHGEPNDPCFGSIQIKCCRDEEVIVPNAAKEKTK